MTKHAENSLTKRNTHHGAISSSLTAIGSFLRGVPLFFAARPRTPLRVLCVMAFDTLYKLQHAQRLPWSRLQVLSSLLDFGACANAGFDNKTFCREEFRSTRRVLEVAGAASVVDEYLNRLRALEKQRPGVGGDQRQFQRVRLYREEIVRLSLAVVAAIASGHYCLDDQIHATVSDKNLETLFRIVMQCQVIDDVLDYSHDVMAELPSFLTALQSLPLAFERTQLATQSYAREHNGPRSTAIFPLRCALFGISIFARLAVAISRPIRCAHEAAVGEVRRLPGRPIYESSGVYPD